MDANGNQVEVLKTFRNASKNTKTVKGLEVFADLLKVRLKDGSETVICETQLNN